MSEDTNSPAPAVVKAGVKGKSNAEINAELKARAAKQAAKKRAEEAKTAKQAQAALAAGELAAPPPVDTVTCRVTKTGDGKVSMGEHIAGLGEAHYEFKEEFQIAKDIAEELEQRGFVEIQ